MEMYDVLNFLDLRAQSTILEWRQKDFSRFLSLLGELFIYKVPQELRSNFELYIDNVPPTDDLKGFSPASLRDIVIYDKGAQKDLARIRIPYSPDDIIFYKNRAYVLPLELADEPIYAQYPALVRSPLVELNAKHPRNKYAIFLPLTKLNEYNTGITVEPIKTNADASKYDLKLKTPAGKLYGVVISNKHLRAVFKREIENKQTITLKRDAVKNLPFIAYYRLTHTYGSITLSQYLCKIAEIYNTRAQYPIGILEFRYVRLYEYILELVEVAFENIFDQYKHGKKRQNIIVYKSILHQLITKKHKLNYVNLFSPFAEIRMKTRAYIPYDIPITMRNLDDSQMYNVCPFDTPDKDDTGATLSITPTADIDELGRFNVNYFRAHAIKES